MDIFFAWEKLRIAYNGVLILIVICVCGRAVIFILDSALVAAICANLMFCAGPVVECYLAWAGVPRLAARCAVFGLGLLLAIGITILAAFDAMRNLPQWP